MIKKIFVLLTMVGLFAVLYPLISHFEYSENLSELASKYVTGSVEDLKSQNVVTSVIVTYRGLDTLGEVTVLFLATAGIGFLLGKRKGKKRKSSELLQTTSSFLMGLIILFGVYIFTHGHLTPGGGFQGGVIIATAFLLLILTDVNMKINHTILQVVEAFSGAFYVGIGIVGLVLMIGFLNPEIIPLGKFGYLFSAGAIPIIYSLVGLKVGAELTNILDTMRGE
ncbi:MAG: hydrogen gas-evolving membrane-bound hydrogenase subunit E [Candidatus Marinimicrobia bacterium]|nr:hydrogen gas-evolving membrane-bound hydrogenase subunit E [Candidatus Neomarinimicrobiota bacterium]